MALVDGILCNDCFLVAGHVNIIPWLDGRLDGRLSVLAITDQHGRATSHYPLNGYVDYVVYTQNSRYIDVRFHNSVHVRVCVHVYMYVRIAIACIVTVVMISHLL